MGTCLCHDHLPASPLADFCASFVSAALCTISTACTSRWDARMCMPDGGWRAPWSTADLGARTALEERYVALHALPCVLLTTPGIVPNRDHPRRYVCEPVGRPCGVVY